MKTPKSISKIGLKVKWNVSILFFIVLLACENSSQEHNPIVEILNKQPEKFKTFLDNPDRYELQIIYTQINRDSLQRPLFKTYYFNHQPDKYFYPASTVKFPAALLALEKINEMDSPKVDKYTPLLIDSAHDSQSRAWIDSTAESGLPSVAHYIKKIFLVSDNDAFNRLYEFIGQREFNSSLRDKGYEDTRIGHRLSLAKTAEENAITNPWRMIDAYDTLAYEPLRKSDLSLWPDTAILMGKGYYSEGKLIEEPMDFSKKNYFPLGEQQQMLRAVIFPNFVPEKMRFELSDDDYLFLYDYMSRLPQESTYPAYPDLPDNYVKFLMYGLDSLTLPDHIRIFNKIGLAYGYLTDNAYIVDSNNNVEYLLSVTIHTNANRIFNDNQYEYDSIAGPFFRDFGKAIHQFEIDRERDIVPDLSAFFFERPD